MNVNDEFIVDIEKMLFGGDSLARIDNLSVFIPGGCPGDKVKVKIDKINKKFAYASIVEFIEKSSNRVEPVCALHNVCGSCNWQYISYDEQLKQKTSHTINSALIK